MDEKIPHIPDFVPGKNVVKPNISAPPSGLNRRKKIYLGLMVSLVLLIGLSFFAVGQPVKIAKKAFTAPESKGTDYNRSVYNISCQSPNSWYVASANPATCGSGGDGGIVCGQICPQDRQVTTNPEGDVCCRPPDIPVPSPSPTITPPVPDLKSCFSDCDLRTASSRCPADTVCAPVGSGVGRCVSNPRCALGSGKDCWCGNPTPNPPGGGNTSCPKPKVALQIFCPLCSQ